MSKKDNKYREHWYDGLKECFDVFIPYKKNKTYHTIAGRRARTGVLFILPFIIGFVLFMIRPLWDSLQMSFCDVSINPGYGYNKTFNNFDNYNYALVRDGIFLEAIRNETASMVINTIATLILSFVIAVILNQEFKGRTLARAILFLPVILSAGVLVGIEDGSTGMLVAATEAVTQKGESTVNISGALRQILQVSGVGSTVFDTLFRMIDSIYDIVMASGIQIVIVLSGLQSISPSLYEAADVEGCTAWEAFWKITFPMVSPLLLVNCIYTIVDFFMKTDNEALQRIDVNMYTHVKFGWASAESWVYFGITLVFIAISSLIISKAVKSVNE